MAKQPKKNTLFSRFSLLIIVATFLSTALAPLFNTSTANAAISGFVPGNIISDSAMRRSSSMTTSEIQNFLNAKGSNCTSGSNCLKNYTENGKKAAQIIYEISQKYKINPQVLIVLLQKEVGLVTINNPGSWRYRSATGYGCLDSTPGVCNSSYYGFTNQLKWSATMFNAILNRSSTWYTPYTVGTNYIQYSPAASCGKVQVNIANLATAALYSYTPYTPNRAALNADYGTGDSCSAYGNRNFFLYMRDWFGYRLETPFFQVGTKIYMRGYNNTYYHVINPTQLREFGYGTFFTSIDKQTTTYMNSLTYKGDLSYVVKFGNQSSIYAISSGKKSHFPSRTIYENAYGFTVGSSESVLQSEYETSFVTQSSVAQVLKIASAPEIYYVSGGKKHHIANSTVYTTMGGSSTYNTQASTTLSAAFASQLATGFPIVQAKSYLKASDTNSYYFWDGTDLYRFGADNLSAQPAGVYTGKSQYIEMLDSSSVRINKYMRDSSGSFYRLYRDEKYPLSSSAIAKFQLSASNTPLVSSNVLDRFVVNNSAGTQSAIRFGVSTRIYKNVGAYKIRAVNDLYDLSMLSIPMSSVKSLPADFETLYNNQGIIFSQNRLVRASGSTKIYFADNISNTLLHISTVDIAQQYGIKLNNISLINSISEASSYSTSELGRISKSCGGIYYVADSRRLLKIDATTAAKFNYNFSTAPVIPASLISTLPSTETMKTLIRDSTYGRVYSVHDGKKYWIVSRVVFDAHYKWSDVTTVSSGLINSLPSGSAIQQ